MLGRVHGRSMGPTEMTHRPVQSRSYQEGLAYSKGNRQKDDTDRALMSARTY